MAPTWATASVRMVGGSDGASVGRPRQVRLVDRHVLDADDPLVRLELGDRDRPAGTDSGAAESARWPRSPAAGCRSIDESGDPGSQYTSPPWRPCHAQAPGRRDARRRAPAALPRRPSGPRRSTTSSTQGGRRADGVARRHAGALHACASGWPSRTGWKRARTSGRSPTDGSAPARQITFGEKGDSQPQWSPDGSYISFVSARGGAATTPRRRST